MFSTYCKILGPGGHRFGRQMVVARRKMTQFWPLGPLLGKNHKKAIWRPKNGQNMRFLGSILLKSEFLFAPTVRSMPGKYFWFKSRKCFFRGFWVARGGPPLGWMGVIVQKPGKTPKKSMVTSKCVFFAKNFCNTSHLMR